MHEVIENLWGSLHRASDHLSTSSVVRRYSTGDRYYVAIGLQEAIDPKALVHLKNYMRDYLAESGWKVGRFKVHRRHVDFELSLSSKDT